MVHEFSWFEYVRFYLYIVYVILVSTLVFVPAKFYFCIANFEEKKYLFILIYILNSETKVFLCIISFQNVCISVITPIFYHKTKWKKKLYLSKTELWFLLPSTQRQSDKPENVINNILGFFFLVQ